MGCSLWIKEWAVGVLDFWLIHKKNFSWKNILGKSSNYRCIPVKIWHNLMIIGSIYEHQEKWSYFPRYFWSRKLHFKPNTAKRAHPEGSIFWNRTFFVGCHQMIRIGVVELSLYFVFLKQIKWYLSSMETTFWWKQKNTTKKV